MLLQPNTTFDNHYTLIRQLGRGGFSEVWLAHDSYMDIDVAIKIYAPGQGMDSNSINEFRREITGVFQLNHPNLLCPKHLGIWENMPYLIMAYCPAGSCLKFVGNISESEIWHLIHDVAAGLAYLHEKDIVHQDIKPDNILVDTEGNYLITDFGISTRARSTLRKSVMSGNTSGGTTAYMGPERFSREPAPTKASDIWSFGAMAFELLEGFTPFGEIGGGMQKGGAEIPFIKAPVSDALKYTIFKMLSKETWDRPTAVILVEWANNPDVIEVDYDLLTDNDDATSPVPAPAPLINKATTGRETQRFGLNKAIDNTATVTFSSTQLDELFLSVNPTELKIPAAGGTTRVTISTNGEWILPSSTQQWMQISKQSDDSFIINCEPNVTGKQRESKLFITAEKTSESLCVNINVYQLALKKKKTWLYLTCITIVAMLLAWIALISPKTYEIIGYTPSEAIVKSLKMKGKTELATALHHRDYGDIYAQASVIGDAIYEGEPFILQVKEVGSSHIHYNVKGAEYIPNDGLDVVYEYIEDIYTPNYSDSYDVGYMPITNSSSVVISFYIEVNQDEKVELGSYTFDVKKRQSHNSQYVDLGLPSGTLWKKENEGGNSAYYTYDEAVSKFGNKLPTTMHFTELIDKCKWTWTGSGYKIIGPNGNFIYLPAAGSRLATGEVLSVGISGGYWSSTLRDSNHPQKLYFYSGANIFTMDGSYGNSVRLVWNL